MDLDVRNCERQKSKQDVDLVSEKDKIGVDKEVNGESNSLLSPRGGGMAERERSSRRKVQWNDKNGNKLFEVLEFQPRYGQYTPNLVPLDGLSNDPSNKIKEVDKNGEFSSMNYDQLVSSGDSSDSDSDDVVDSCICAIM